MLNPHDVHVLELVANQRHNGGDALPVVASALLDLDAELDVLADRLRELTSAVELVRQWIRLQERRAG